MANPKIPKGYSGTYVKNSSGEDTLIMVTSEQTITNATPKGAKTMAKSTAKPAADSGNQNNNGGFQPTFRKYADMSDGEKAAFRQGAKTQARDYCQKSDTRIGDNYEYGEFVAEGERADLIQLKELVDAGVSDYELGNIACKAYVRHMQFVDRRRQRNAYEKFGKVRRLDLEVTYIYGKAGVGKTRYVMDE